MGGRCLGHTLAELQLLAERAIAAWLIGQGGHRSSGTARRRGKGETLAYTHGVAAYDYCSSIPKVGRLDKGGWEGQLSQLRTLLSRPHSISFTRD
jgi:hypothetical protein